MKKLLAPIILFECSCPPNSALTEIPTADCDFNLKQIQRLGFQRLGTNFDTAGTPATDIKLLADWQAKIAATDDTKIVVSPMIAADPTITSGDAITNGGGDNSTLNGVEEVEGRNPSTFSATFKGLSPAIEKAMKLLECEKNLVVYFFLQGGRIAAKVITPDEKYTGFKAQSFTFSDRNNAGFGTKDTHTLNLSLPAGWSENLHVFEASELDFNPLLDL